jgi:uncharacterized protein YbaR (Trm112 family)
MTLIDPGLAEILVCTVCHGSLRQEVEASLLVCTACGRSYPVRDGIPIMLVGEPGPTDE